MHLVPTEEQEYLSRAARDMGAKRSPIERMRQVRDTGEWERSLWKEMCDLGWSGVHVDEAYGGSEMGFAALCTLVEELGRTLAPEPMVSTTAIGASALTLTENDAARDAYLGGLLSGDILGALAHDEPNVRHADHAVALRADQAGNGFVLNGTKTPVWDGGFADLLIVSARTGSEDDLILLAVEADLQGVTVERLVHMDGRDAATVTFDKVNVGHDAVLAEGEAAACLVTTLLDRGRIAVAAEMLGSAQAAFDLTTTYLKERRQFGVPIGSFQALQHRAAYLLSELELARSAVIAAAHAVDQAPENVSVYASLAKAVCTDMFIHVAHEGIQMHGGIGVTDEHDIGLFLKRARVAQFTWGDAGFHRRRWATLRGY